MSWKTNATAALAVFGLLGVADGARAADYPCDSVEWIVGWGAGGGSDTFARSIAPGVSDALGVPVQVINMPGASSIVAMEEVLSRPADGCTVFSVTPDQITNELTGLTEPSSRSTSPGCSSARSITSTGSSRSLTPCSCPAI